MCYLIGEFGHLLATEEPPVCSWAQLAKAIVRCEQMAKTSNLRAICITAAAKIYNGCADADERTQNGLIEWLRGFATDVDLEVQQRAVEFVTLCSQGDAELLENVLALMPAFPKKFANNSPLVKRSMARIPPPAARKILKTGAESSPPPPAATLIPKKVEPVDSDRGPRVSCCVSTLISATIVRVPKGLTASHQSRSRRRRAAPRIQRRKTSPLNAQLRSLS